MMVHPGLVCSGLKWIFFVFLPVPAPVVGFSSKVIFWKKIQRGWDLLQGEVAIIALL